MQRQQRLKLTPSLLLCSIEKGIKRSELKTLCALHTRWCFELITYLRAGNLKGVGGLMHTGWGISLPNLITSSVIASSRYDGNGQMGG